MTAELSPDNEVPPAAGSSASGTAHLTLNQRLGEICVDILSGGYSDSALAGHIHEAEAGSNGPVVVNLMVASGNHSICVDVDMDLVKTIRQNPSGFYINIHTADPDGFPGGEVRGQLAK